MDINIKSEILELIGRKAEGEYWDFKQQWYSHNADLLHDIIYMANSPANRDCYIIIGVEDKTYNILGVGNKNRKTQQNVIDLLHQKPVWAGGYIPEIYVKTIIITDKEVDVVVVKQSNNTPFYLLKDYISEGQPVFKGAIYTRKGDTNTPKTETADLYDTELLWKRRLGLLYNPSQQAKIYLKDLDNWEMVSGEINSIYDNYTLFFYRPDPDYTVHFFYEDESDKNNVKDINDATVGIKSYYLFAFCNISYNTDYDCQEKVALFYKEVPLFSSIIERVDEWRTSVVPPKLSIVDPYYIQDSFRYLMFEFVFAHYCENHSVEAREMILRVIPIYRTKKEHDEFTKYIKSKGFRTIKLFGETIGMEASERLKRTYIGQYEGYNVTSIESISDKLSENKNMVINFAALDNIEYNRIMEHLQKGKMLVDWLNDYRNQ